jgi:hypothetical protein
MGADNIISAITRVGSVILTTVLSFVVLPPSIEGESDSVINWKNIFTFFAGIVSIFLYEKMKGHTKRKYTSFVIVILLVLCAAAYEIVYDNYSIKCFDKMPVIITNSDVRPEMKERFNYWKTHSQDPVRSLVESNECSSIKIWPLSAIAVPYYSLLVLYFSIIVLVILLVAMTADLRTQKTPQP